jgi:iron complex transport system substrate-binding protein
MRALSTEGVLSLSPSLIIANEKAGPPEVVAALKQSSVPYVSITAPDTPQGTEQRIRAVASAVQNPQKADSLVRSVRQKFEALAAKRATITKPARVLFLLSLQNGRATAAGSATAAHEVISLAGGVNVVTVFEGYKPLADEAALGLAPDIILVMKRSQQAGSPSDVPLQALIAAMPGLSATPAARNGRVIEVDGAALLQFGPRTADEAANLMSVFHPGKQAEMVKP